MNKFVKISIVLSFLLVSSFILTPEIIHASGNGGTTSTQTATTSATTKTNTQEQSPATSSEEGDIILPQGWATDFQAYFNKILGLVFVIAVMLVFFNLIMAGFSWITAGSDKGKTDGARSRIMNAVIGLIVLAASYAILMLVLNFLGIDNINVLFASINRPAAK